MSGNHRFSQNVTTSGCNSTELTSVELVVLWPLLPTTELLSIQGLTPVVAGLLSILVAINQSADRVTAQVSAGRLEYCRYTPVT
ncbi:hypothetical protein J6590_002227 [Homalodisca vitripennis]|nr:hypothetical protein J6590_002227 [Homalodisca vitripennis]